MYSVENRIAVQSHPSSGTNCVGGLVAPAEASSVGAFIIVFLPTCGST